MVDVAYVRCVATFPHVTGLPEDAIVNTWAFKVADPLTRGGAATAWTTALNTFYGAIKANLSSQIAWNSGTYEYIDLNDDRPRIPYQTDSAALGTLSTGSFDAPAEVAVCLSFRGAAVSGANMRRRRGRVYIGPLQMSNVDNPTLSNGVADAIAAAGAALKGLTNQPWCVYSRYEHHGVPVGDNIRDHPDEIELNLPGSFTPVTTVWVDNAWDVQRRRGPKATYRKTL